MAVPSHDLRDYEFAVQYQLPLKPVIVGGSDDPVYEGEGEVIHSSCEALSLNGLSSTEAQEKVLSWVEERGIGYRKVHYKLRDWLFSRQRYWGEPIPILHFADGTKRMLEVDELPLVPPQLDDFTPPGDGTSSLTKVPKWVNIIDPKTGVPAVRETNTMPQWAGSCWYYLRFCDPHNDQEAWEKKKESYWMPVDLYVGGAEHAVLHLLYARFWHKVLYDCGYVSHAEPFASLRNQGLVVARSFKNAENHYVPVEEVSQEGGVYFHVKTGEPLSSQIEKMSKSKLNGVPPDEIIHEYGADTFRVAIAFMGPLEKEKVWTNDALTGCQRFLFRVYDMVTSDKVRDEHDEEVERLTHRLVSKVKEGLEHLHFNTVVAKLMEFVNELVGRAVYPKKAMERFVQLLSFFAPHLGEELWQYLGHKESVSVSSFPEIDPQYLVDEIVTYVIQVNGKVRGKLELPKDRPNDEIIALAFKHPNVSRFVSREDLVNTIVVPNRLLNFVTRG